LLLFAVILCNNAWVCDDAYITLRTVDHFLHGRGLVWNAGERVQAYTHPLWMFVLSGFVAVFRQVYYTAIFLCIAISIGTASLLAWRVARFPLAAAALISLMTVSKGFMDYSTSGLENPLTHLLLVGFFTLYLREDLSRRGFFFLALLAGLGTFNRMDTILLYALPLCAAAWKRGNWRAILWLAAGFSPFLCWLCFSLFYYGFPFPNTAYAKLNTGIPASELLIQGFHYLGNSLRWDPITLTVIGAALVFGAVSKNKKLPMLSGGIAFYLIYTVRIGGDFMSGRFLAAPFLTAVIVLSESDWPRTRWGSMGIMVAAALAGFFVERSPLPSNAHYGQRHLSVFDSYGVTDERCFYYNGTGLLRALRNKGIPEHEWTHEGEDARAQGKKLVMDPGHGIGFFGYFAGPEVYIVDPLALSDPLLSRLPMRKDNQHIIITNQLTVVLKWRIGHFRRAIPLGYEETLRTGKTVIHDTKVAKLYDILQLITRGNLFDGRRLKAIWDINTGKFRDLAHGDYEQVP
ncbi:hypothetical protein HYR69_03540, partial [Candidatus Sumerlaeota bacterium]|nr:hypothetical protein [Candidatus Sumerlaeota bacterium]MBI3736228.1 hypothetical protein [Candidatus Sumerlaeota bacterium]